MAIEKGDKVTLEYEGKFENGEVFDSSAKAGKPLTFSAGVGMVVPGFDNNVLGMEKNEEKEFTLEPENAYGEYRDELKKQIPRDVLPKEQDFQPGMILGMQMPNGQQIPVRIVGIDENNVSIDINHPLAGKKLFFKIKITDVESGQAEDSDSDKKQGEKKEGSVEDIV